MRKLIGVFSCVCLSTVAFSQSINFENYRILNVGSIAIPNNMEVQSGNYKKLADAYQKDVSNKFGYEVSDNRIVFQQKGLNDLERQGLASYVRIILETDIRRLGDFDKTSVKPKLTQQEILDLSTELKNQIQQSFAGTGLKLIAWYGVSMVEINGKNAMKTSYLRQLNDKPYVLVNMYRFQNNDRLHTLTLAYRQSDGSTWKPLLTKVASSFMITNVR